MSGQFHIFLLCVLIGVVGGILYDALFFVRSMYRRRWLRILCDVLFCICFAIFFVFISLWLDLPAVRAYFLLGCILGLLLYLKSFHKIVAFFAEKLYNSIVHHSKGNTVHGRRKKRRNTG